MRRIKVLQFLSTAYPAGTELSTLSLVSRMDREKFDLEVCFLYPKGPLSNKFLAQNIKCYHLDYGLVNIFVIALRLYKILKIGRYDLIHIYGLKANIIGRLIGRLAGCKNIVAGLRSIYPGNKESNLHLFLDKITLCLVKLYISNSKTAVDFLIEKGYPSKIFKVVHSGIDLVAQTKKQESKGSTIITVARFEPPKDYKTLLLAFDILNKKGIKFTSLLVGGMSKKEEMMELSARMNLKDKVLFLGEKENVSEDLAKSDIFAFSSLFEGLPRAIMEAMAASLPVVATDVGGVSELVNDGKTGFLVKAEDAQALAESIEKLLLDKDLRKRMGEAGMEKIQKEFSMDRLVKEMEEIYTQIT
ncbi:MAG: glycosyltransferase [bacterium]|nr:glycosyltransferase [bacterium]